VLLCVAVAVCVAGLYVQVSGQSFQKCYTVGENNHCFRTIKRANDRQSRKTWTAAVSYCESGLKGNYSLAAIDDTRAQDALEHFMDLCDFVDSGMFVWLGISQTSRGEWFWTDGTPYTGSSSSSSNFL